LFSAAGSSAAIRELMSISARRRSKTAIRVFEISNFNLR
jgi:hypothetical protein